MSVSFVQRMATLMVLGLLLSPAACQSTPDEKKPAGKPSEDPTPASEYLEDARSAISAGEAAEASAMLDLAGDAGAASRELAQVRARLERLRARQSRDEGDIDAAFEHYLAASRHEPVEGKRFEDLIKAVEAGSEAGKPPAQLAKLADEASNLVMASERVHRFAARLWDDAGNAERALPHYKWLHKMHPDDTSVAARLGTLYAAEEQLDRARALLSDARRADPKNVQIALQLAQVFEELGEVDRADGVYASLLKAFPDKAGILFRYAAFLERQGQTDRAKQMREDARKKLPGVERRDMRRLR